MLATSTAGHSVRSREPRLHTSETEANSHASADPSGVSASEEPAAVAAVAEAAPPDVDNDDDEAAELERALRMSMAVDSVDRDGTV